MRSILKLSSLYIGIIISATIISGCEVPTQNENSDEKASIKAHQSQYLVGSYTQNTDQGIYQILLDHSEAHLVSSRLVAATDNPSYLAWAAPEKVILAVNQNMAGGVSSFAWNKEAGAFDLVKRLDGLGDIPCFIAVSPDRKYFAIANYVSRDVHLFSLGKNGEFELQNSVSNTGKGEHPRQDAPHPHWIDWGIGAFIYSVDLGLDKVFKYKIENNKLTKIGPALEVESGDGPRHMVFHPKRSRAYLVNELSNTILALDVDINNGDMTIIQRLSTLKPGFSAHSQAGAIKLSPDGNFVYVSNRGANTIAGFKIDEQGQLEYIGETSVVGDWPRDFHISEDGEFVIVANQNSNTVNLLRRDTISGRLTPTESYLDIHIPTSVMSFPK